MSLDTMSDYDLINHPNPVISNGICMDGNKVMRWCNGNIMAKIGSKLSFLLLDNSYNTITYNSERVRYIGTSHLNKNWSSKDYSGELRSKVNGGTPP